MSEELGKEKVCQYRDANGKCQKSASFKIEWCGGNTGIFCTEHAELMIARYDLINVKKFERLW